MLNFGSRLVKSALRVGNTVPLTMAAVGMLLASSCNSEKLLSARFEIEAIGSEPNIDQEVGKCRVVGIGSVRIEHLPGGGGKWVHLTTGPEVGSHARFRCSFIGTRGEGHYLVTFRLFIPDRMGAFVRFQSGATTPPTEFFTLELPTNGILRDPTSFSVIGRFPHDKVFSVAVNLEIGSASRVEVTLLGGAQGSFTRDVPSSSIDFPRTFSAIELLTDSSIPGSTFFADDLLAIFNRPSTRR